MPIGSRKPQTMEPKRSKQPTQPFRAGLKKIVGEVRIELGRKKQTTFASLMHRV
jgi:hypothetical protein